MFINQPQDISLAEWKEIMQFQPVKDGWGLDDDESEEQFASKVYAVKFDFTSGGPGYCGDLYILQGDALEAPMVLIREDGRGQLKLA
jgi:hypothetical protein